MGVTTLAEQLYSVKSDRGQAPAEAEMPECKFAMSVDVHTAAAIGTDTVRLREVQRAVKTENFPTRDRGESIRIGIIETFQ